MTVSPWNTADSENPTYTGEPMAGARVTVFSVAYPTHAWLTGRADREGRFRFVPDPSQPGDWSVRIRQEGHGGTIGVRVGHPGVPAGD
jgi:nickel transport protein